VIKKQNAKLIVHNKEIKAIDINQATRMLGVYLNLSLQ